MLPPGAVARRGWRIQYGTWCRDGAVSAGKDLEHVGSKIEGQFLAGYSLQLDVVKKVEGS